jgi:HlyD family secretion protein
MNKKKLTIASGIVLLVSALYFSGVLPQWHRERTGQTIHLSGNIEAHESVLSFNGLQARVVQLPFNEGQWVAKGTVLAVVDQQELNQQVAVAAAGVAVQRSQLDMALENVTASRKTVEADLATLAQRQLDVERSQALQRQGFLARAALDNAATALKQARAQLERDRALAQVAQRSVKVAQAGVYSGEQTEQLSRIMAGYATLVAPFDGVVLTRQAELGEVVAPGTPIITLADLDHVWLRAYLNEPDLGRVRLGQEVAVTSDSFPDKRFTGKLSFIAAKAEFTPRSVETHAERVTLVYRVKIDIDNRKRQFVPGMPADAALAPAQP